jgi:hypothetical protein
MFKVLMPASMLLLVAAGAQAQETQRYQLEKTEKGYVRLDLQTGAMSICEDKDTQLVCRAAVEEKSGSASSGDSDRLRQLERRVEVLERASGGKTLTDTDEEFEQGLTWMESFFRRFMGIAREFQREQPEAMPDRT